MKVTMKVDLEKYCLKARDMFWLEKVKLSEVFEFLYQIFPDELSEIEKKEIAIDIIEGRKIVKGMNEGEIFDDNENVKLLADFYEEEEKKFEFLKLKEDMYCNPIKYIDSYCGGFSHMFSEPNGTPKLKSRFEELTGYELIDSISSYRNCKDAILSAGMYLFNDDLLAQKMLKKPCKDSFDFFIKCNRYWYRELKRLKEQGVSYENLSTFMKEVVERMNSFPNFLNPYSEENWIQLLSEKDEENDYFFTREGLNFIYSGDRNRKTNISQQNDFNSEKDLFSTLNKKREITYFSNIKGNVPQPIESDNHISFSGFISPDGNWYSCSYGGHELLSIYILSGINYLEIVKRNTFDFTSPNTKNLMEKGFLKVQIKTGRDFEVDTFETFNSLSQKQFETLYEHILKYPEYEDDLELFLERNKKRED